MEGLLPSPCKSFPHTLPYAVSSFKASRACQVIIPYLGIGKAGPFILCDPCVLLQLSEWNGLCWCGLDQGLECTGPLMLSWVPPCHKAANSILGQGSDGASWTTPHTLPLTPASREAAPSFSSPTQGTQTCYFK